MSLAIVLALILSAIAPCLPAVSDVIIRSVKEGVPLDPSKEVQVDDSQQDG